MNAKQIHESKEFREAARNLLSAVSKLVDEAEKTSNGRRRRDLYLQAMGMSNEAYSLLAKAREFNKKTARPEKMFSSSGKTVSTRR